MPPTKTELKTENKTLRDGSGDVSTTVAGKRLFLYAALLIFVSLSVLFWRSYDPAYVHFSNDGPLGGMVAEQNRLPKSFDGVWIDLNWLGSPGIATAPAFTTLLRLLTSPEWYARLLPPASLMFAGLCAFFCFRRFKFVPVACVLGALVAALDSDFFSTSCWGVASQVVGFGANYAALGFLMGNGSRRQWIRVVLAGMAVGVGIMEAYDIGAIFSLFVAAFVIYQALFMREGALPAKVGRGILRVVLVAGCAAFIACSSLNILIGTQLKNIEAQNDMVKQASKEAAWEFATEFSLPKKEFLQVLIPGVFGYRQNWHMYEDDQPAADQYWGTIGYAPGLTRLTGTGYYGGVLVLLIAVWAICSSFRGEQSPFDLFQRRALWFWTGAMVLAALMAFGKFAPFFQFFYALPGLSSIRNPTKFMHVFHWALIIVFAYGVHGLWKTYMKNPAVRATGLTKWWASAAPFERKWILGSIAAIVVSLVGWLLYTSAEKKLKEYLPTVDIPPEQVNSVVNFSFHSVSIFILLLVVSAGLLTLIFSGLFSGSRAKWAGFVLGAFILLDLGRADKPWVVYWNIAYKFRSDPIIQLLADKPYEHRVALLPIDPRRFGIECDQFPLLASAYGSHWKQELFQYYNIQCADIIQEPRPPADKMQFSMALPLDNAFSLFRFWELSNTRYLLAPGNGLAAKMDPSGQKIRQVVAFNFVPKTNDPGPWPVNYYAEPNTNGQLSIIEYSDALPRAKLYSHWQIMTNDTNTLHELADPNFDPHHTVIISNADGPTPPVATTNTQPEGSVEINPNYRSRRVELTADVKTPSILFLSERYDPNWHVQVDGQPAKLLRCDFIMRGVYLTSGKHNIVFNYAPPIRALMVTLFAIAIGLGLICWLALTPEPESEIETVEQSKKS